MIGRVCRRIGQGRLGALLALLALVLPGGPAAAAPPHPLFASDAPVRLTISGPIAAIQRAASRSTDAHEATLTVHAASPETHAIRLSARGLTRRRSDVCSFPPLRIELVDEPPEGSLLRGQRRLKLVTHCRGAESFQQHLLLEYAAYRLFNLLTPVSFRTRFAEIDYAEPGVSQPLSRLGFLVEDVDDAARRNGLVEVDVGSAAIVQLSPRETARVAVFQYMIGNVDWSPRQGAPGELCCHNSKLLGHADGATATLIPIPYDFDYSGLVDAPYSVPPPALSWLVSVRTRHYRGFCAHRAETQAAAAEALAERARLLAVIDEIPRLTERTRRRARAYLERFFEDVRSPDAVESNLMRTCVG